MTESGFASYHRRTAVVTGASSGIGRAIARELATAGADLVLTCVHSADRLGELCDELRPLGRAIYSVVGNLGFENERTRLITAAWDHLDHVDLWVNNAGVDLLTGPLAKAGFDEKLARLLAVDVSATVALSRAAGERMRQRGRGAIVTVGWDQADRGMEGDSGELFAVAKNAIMGFTRSLSLSLAPQVRVNCVAPGWIKTAWGEQAGPAWQERVIRETPLRRWGVPEDIAKTVRFLGSDDASFITGQIWNVNGGAVR